MTAYEVLPYRSPRTLEPLESSMGPKMEVLAYVLGTMKTF